MNGPTEVEQCGWCTEQTRIFWAVTRKRKAMPINAEPDPAGNAKVTFHQLGAFVEIFKGPPGMFDDWTAYMPHHATCARNSALYKLRQRQQNARNN